MLLRICEFAENQDREHHTLIVGLNKISSIHVLYNILK